MNEARNDLSVIVGGACPRCGSADAEIIRHITQRGWVGSTRTPEMRCRRCGTIHEGEAKPALKKFRVALAMLLMFFLIGLFLSLAGLLPGIFRSISGAK